MAERARESSPPAVKGYPGVELASQRRSDSAPVSSVIHLDRKELGTIAVALAPTFAGIVVEDELTLGIFLLVGWAAWVYLCIIHEGSRSARVFVALLATAVYGGIEYRKTITGRETQQQETYNRLSLEFVSHLPLADESPVLLYSIKNGSGNAVVKHRVTCVFNKIQDGQKSGFIVGGTKMLTGWINNPIEAGGGGQTEQCYSQFMKFNGPVVCADITAKLEYSLSSQPALVREKSFRYMTSQLVGFTWIQQSTDMQGNFCDGLQRSTIENHK